ncbi:MAG TPA: hypothetical protein VK915_11880 [Gaiellaceae bacterium]|nr:hypothetical protein [Gaiellaceae bacterium]
MTRMRHGELLRLARNGELAARLAEARREERRSLAARLRARAASPAPRPSAAS